MLGSMIVFALSFYLFGMQMLWYYIDHKFMWYVYYVAFFLMFAFASYSFYTANGKPKVWFIAIWAILMAYMPYDVIPLVLFDVLSDLGSNANLLSAVTKGLSVYVRAFVEVIFYPAVHFILLVMLAIFLKKPSRNR